MRAEDWMDANNCLPENGTEVLVYDDAFGILVAEYTDGYGWDSHEYGYLENVTHWMWLVLPKTNKLWANI